MSQEYAQLNPLVDQFNSYNQTMQDIDSATEMARDDDPDMRAMASAVLLFILNIVGLGLGPVIVGLLNEQLAAMLGEASIRGSLLVVALVGGTAAPFFWLSSRHLEDDLGRR